MIVLALIECCGYWDEAHEDIDGPRCRIREQEGSHHGDRACANSSPRRAKRRVLFASVETFAKVLSQRNRRLLALIAEEKPDSITELARLAGQSRSQIARILKTMSLYGLVEFQAGEQGRLIPQVAYDQVRLEVSLTAPLGLADSAN